jgi:hypothetical protein
MLKVWALFEEARGWDSSTSLVGIFRTEQAAEQAAKEKMKSYFSRSFWVEEVEVQE